jgi:hypothetical protein
MGLRFSAGAPAGAAAHLPNWVPNAAAGATRSGGPDVSVSNGYEVVMISVDDLADGRLLDAVSPGRWRFLVLEDDVPYGELEFEGTDAICVHHGPAKDAFIDALEQADQVDGEFVVRVIKSPGVRFIGLWLHNADEDWIIPYEPNRTDLRNLITHDTTEVIRVLQPAAEAVQTAMAAAGGLPIGG